MVTDELELSQDAELLKELPRRPDHLLLAATLPPATAHHLVWGITMKRSDLEALEARNLAEKKIGEKVDAYRESLNDPVNHPSHYTSHPSGVECITVTEHMTFNLGNAVKYIWRAGEKTEDPLQDLEKARWYLDREIQRIKKQGEQISSNYPDEYPFLQTSGPEHHDMTVYSKGWGCTSRGCPWYLLNPEIELPGVLPTQEATAAAQERFDAYHH